MQANPHPGGGLTLATKVTLVRLLGVPVFVLLLVYYLMGLRAGAESDYQRIGALILFVAVAATDALDGYLARSRNEVTTLGKALDPLADKSLLLSGLILLTRPSLPGLVPHIPVWFTTLVISRDVLLIAAYFLIHHFAGQVEIRPRWSGKTATVLQMGVILWVLLQAPERWFLPFVVATALVTGISFWHYAVDGIRQLSRAGHR
jgi:cardiolipin synthase